MSNHKRQIDPLTKLHVKMHQMTKKRFHDQPNLRHTGGNLTLMEDLEKLVREHIGMEIVEGLKASNDKFAITKELSGPFDHEAQFRQQLQDLWDKRMIYPGPLENYKILKKEIDYWLYSCGAYHFFEDKRANSETHGWFFDRNTNSKDALPIELSS